MCIVSALLAFFCLPEIGQDTIDAEDARFKTYLVENGYDVQRMGKTVSMSSLGNKAGDV